MSFRIARSQKKFTNSVFDLEGNYYENLEISYQDFYIKKHYVKYVASKIKYFKKVYKKAMSQVLEYKYTQINKACVDIIDEIVFLDKKEEVKVKSIISKEKILSYDGKEYELKKLYTRYI